MDGFEEYEKFDPASFEYIDPIKEYEKPIEEQSMSEKVNRYVSNNLSLFNGFNCKNTIMWCGIVLIILIILFFLYKKYWKKDQITYKLAF